MDHQQWLTGHFGQEVGHTRVSRTTSRESKVNFRQKVVVRTTGHGLSAKGLVARHRVPPVVSLHGTKANMGKSDHWSRHKADRANVGCIASWHKGHFGQKVGHAWASRTKSHYEQRSGKRSEPPVILSKR